MKNFYYIDKKSSQTLIFMQGGPIGYNFMKEDVDKSKVNPMFWLYINLVKQIPNLFSEYNIASVNQEQYKNPENIITSQEEGQQLLKKTLQTLDRTIDHFKSLGHKTLLLGHSYGGYLISEYLKEHGNDKVDNIIIANSRIKTPTLFYDIIVNKKEIPFVNENDEFLGFRNNAADPFGLKLIMAHTMKRDYCQELNNTDLSNVIYLSSYPDKWLGILQKNEITWAKSKGAQVIETGLAELEGFKEVVKINLKADTLSHNSIFFAPIANKVKKLIK